MKGTIKSKEDIERLFQEGRRSSSSSLIMIVLRNDRHNVGRCAYIAGKKLGNAPFRNRCKRVLRAAARNVGAPFNEFDIVFIARKPVAFKERSKVEDEMRSLLSKLKVTDE